ncbi:uncharacterized protein K460DRAFT_410885 [Cucurbitaria berberidis CBS 394.84]|uniref:Uncharacterized protein n=1 Tax=Cucurbitaria berberidis CBS 394.84 TaxID=1168544 RepID=A0A9P4G758_9PLEO|nr:uncharacterized protein K460DRAFT_410885 [Cucurbitaria berberidis CBS 394.84]KAF1840286.1 hypothetical protein K460DRAFT_410885 [Cucurbitaria berberidis CBS 394.84]
MSEPDTCPDTCPPPPTQCNHKHLRTQSTFTEPAIAQLGRRRFGNPLPPPPSHMLLPLRPPSLPGVIVTIPADLPLHAPKPQRPGQKHAILRLSTMDEEIAYLAMHPLPDSSTSPTIGDSSTSPTTGGSSTSPTTGASSPPGLTMFLSPRIWRLQKEYSDRMIIEGHMCELYMELKRMVQYYKTMYEGTVHEALVQGYCEEDMAGILDGFQGKFEGTDLGEGTW